jgi:transposase-like protein
MLPPVAIQSAVAAASLIRLRCPHCDAVQARPRKPKGSRYACKVCRKRFVREEGEARARAHR